MWACNDENKSAGRSGEACFYKGGPLAYELICHLPFSVSAVTLGLILAGLICYLGPEPGRESVGQPSELAAASQPAPAGRDEEAEAGHLHGEDHGGVFALFHLFHPAHMLFSAAATAAMFRRYDRSILKAIIVGLVGAIVVCGVSDIVMPHVSAGILGARPPLHICLVEHPMLVLPFAAVGVLLGIFASVGVTSSTYFSHSLHVFTSSMASIFYLVASLGQTAWFGQIGLVFLFVLLAVMVPCCLSDIVFPLLMTKKAQVQYVEIGHPH